MGWSNRSELTEVAVLCPVTVVIWTPVLEEPEPSVLFEAALGEINKELPNWTTPPLIVSIFTGSGNSDIEEHPLHFNILLYVNQQSFVRRGAIWSCSKVRHNISNKV